MNDLQKFTIKAQIYCKIEEKIFPKHFKKVNSCDIILAWCCLCIVFKEGGSKMAALAEKLKVKSPIKSKFSDEFQSYLKQQCVKTTFNGIELEKFSWYKKVLGLA